jgi:hypothetical protein
VTKTQPVNLRGLDLALARYLVSQAVKSGKAGQDVGSADVSTAGIGKASIRECETPASQVGKLESSFGGFFMPRLRNKLAAISLSLSVLCALNIASAAQTKSSSKSERTSVNQENGNWNWHHNDSTVDLHVTIRGKVEFADDYSESRQSPQTVRSG